MTLYPIIARTDRNDRQGKIRQRKLRLLRAIRNAIENFMSRTISAHRNKTTKSATGRLFHQFNGVMRRTGKNRLELNASL